MLKYLVAPKLKLMSTLDGRNRSTRRKSPTCRKSLTNFITTLLVIDTDCIGSCKSNYHTITITTAPTLKCGFTMGIQVVQYIYTTEGGFTMGMQVVQCIYTTKGDSRWAYKWYNIFIPRRVDSRWVYKWYNIFIPRRVIHDGHTSGTIYIYHGGYINDEHTSGL
jgi:hypothetical protein